MNGELNPESRTSTHCHTKEGQIFSIGYINSKKFIWYPPHDNYAITCIECLGTGQTVQISSGGLNASYVDLDILKTCYLTLWAKRVEYKPSEISCESNGRVVHEGDLTKGQVLNHTLESGVISCLECENQDGVLQSIYVRDGGVGYPSVSARFTNTCHFKVYSGGVVNTLSAVCCLFLLFVHVNKIL